MSLLIKYWVVLDALFKKALSEVIDEIFDKFAVKAASKILIEV